MNADGISHIAGLGPLVTLGGRQWLVKGRQLRYYAMMEAEIIKMRGNPFEMVVLAAANHRQDPGVVNAVAAAVAEHFRNWRFANYKDYGNFNETPYGEAFQVWCAIRHQDEKLTVDQVQFWLMEEIVQRGPERRTEILAAIEQASSEDQLGNSTGPQQIATPVATAG